VTLRNEGSDAYKKEIYGKRITIERKFNREGGSGGYVIKNEDMKVLYLRSRRACTTAYILPINLTNVMIGYKQGKEGTAANLGVLQHPSGQPLLCADTGRVQEVHPGQRQGEVCVLHAG